MRAAAVTNGKLRDVASTLPWRRLLSIAIAACFALLAYTAQTHIHTALNGRPNIGVTKVLHADGQASPDKQDTNGAGDCPLCQAASLCGGLLAPLLLILLYIDASKFVVHPPICVRVRYQRLNRARPTRGPPTF